LHVSYSILLFYFILFYFILFYFILFYFILFYFILFYFILFNLMKIRYEGLNLAEQSPVRNEEEKRMQDRFMHGIASARARLVYQKRKEAGSPAPEMDVVTVNAREFAMPPEDLYLIGEKSL
jgi:hypothetical protein